MPTTKASRTSVTPLTMTQVVAALRAESVTSVELSQATLGRERHRSLDAAVATGASRSDATALEVAERADHKLCRRPRSRTDACHPVRGQGHHRVSGRPADRAESVDPAGGGGSDPAHFSRSIPTRGMDSVTGTLLMSLVEPLSQDAFRSKE